MEVMPNSFGNFGMMRSQDTERQKKLQFYIHYNLSSKIPS